MERHGPLPRHPRPAEAADSLSTPGTPHRTGAPGTQALPRTRERQNLSTLQALLPALTAAPCVVPSGTTAWRWRLHRTLCGCAVRHTTGTMTGHRIAGDAAGLLRAYRWMRNAGSLPARWHGAATLVRNVRPAGAASPPAHPAGSTVGDHNRRDGKARYRSQEM